MQMVTEILRFIDPLSMLIVFGGAVLVAMLRTTRSDAARGLRALGQIIHADPEADAMAAIVAVGKVEKLTEIRNIACVDRIKTAERFLRRAVRRLAQAQTAEAFERWARHDLAERERRHQGGINFWRSVAEAAPAMGMIGTVAGLIQMFAALDDVSKIGPAMALAMLTTFYGIILANVVATPIASRLEQLSAAELSWQREALERMLQIAEAELAPVTPHKRPHLRTVS